MGGLSPTRASSETLRNVDRSWSQGDWWPRRARGRDSGWCAPRSRRCSRPAWLTLAPAARAACPAPAGSNEIVVENCQTGSPRSEWDISGAGDTSIQGFATNMSVNRGTSVSFKISTPATSYRIDIYRMGYYGGDGARKVATINPDASLAHNQPACLTNSSGLVDCGNWGVSASWAVPASAVSGIYFAHLVRTDVPSDGSHVFFVVRNDASQSDIYYQTSDTTWQAYNDYGGNSLYEGGPLSGGSTSRAAMVSYNRPFVTRAVSSGQDWVFNAEYPMVRWLERNGYDVSYETGVDTDRFGSLIRNHKVFMATGHDEYWSGAQRANVEAARNAGVNLAFFSGNEVFWRTRWQASIDGSNTAYRTLVSYKETHENAHVDPSGEWTGTWRDARSFNPQGPKPENALTGTIFMVNAGTRAIRVPADAGKLRFWRNTSVANLAAGTEATLSDGTLGYEWDSDLDNGSRPPGLVDLSSTTESGLNVLQDNGSTYGDGSATHSLTLYRASSGALVFGAGTVQWSWGLDANHDRDTSTADPRMQQATVNLFADMHSQPGSLDPSLTAASASTDTAAPSTAIVSPATGTTVTPGTTVTIQGTATDAGGGRVGGVEVSLDGGTSWHPASGRESWRYTWNAVRRRPGHADGPRQPTTAPTSARRPRPPSASAAAAAARATSSATSPRPRPPTTTRRSRSACASAPTSTASSPACATTAPRRRRRGSATCGPRAARSSPRPPSWATRCVGWHTVSLSPAVRVTKDTTYVASFLSSDGTYYADPGFFNAAFDAAPLHAPAGTNGVYKYGGGFPTDSFDATSYGADVLFTPTDQTAPQVTSVAPAGGAASVDPGTQVAVAFDEGVDPATADSGSFFLRNEAGALVPADVTYDAAARTATLRPRSPLAWATTYTATVKGGAVGFADLAGNPLAQDRTWSFTTAAPPPGFNGPGEVGTKGSQSGAGSGPSQHGSTSSAAKRALRLAAHGPGVEERDGQAARDVSRGHAQLPRPAQAPGRQAHRRDQDGDGGRRQDQDGHAQAEPRRPQRPEAQALAARHRRRLRQRRHRSRPHPAALTQTPLTATRSHTSHDTDRHPEQAPADHRGRPRARRAAPRRPRSARAVQP